MVVCQFYIKMLCKHRFQVPFPKESSLPRPSVSGQVLWEAEVERELRLRPVKETGEEAGLGLERLRSDTRGAPDNKSERSPY